MSEPSSPPLPRFGLAAVCLAHAVVLGLAATTLPWRPGTTSAVILWLLVALHVATAVTAVLQRALWLTWSWRALSVVSLLAFVLSVFSMSAAALYVTKLYIRLGPTVASVIIVLGVLFTLLTVPIGVWGALRTWPARARAPRRVGLGALVLLGISVLTLPLVSRAAQGDPVERASSELGSDLRDLLDEHALKPPRGMRRSVAGAGPAECEHPIDTERLTLFVSYVRRNRARSACLQATTARELRRALNRTLRRSRPGSTVVIDLVRTVKPLQSNFPLLDALQVRPGLDGVCEGKLCLRAWQLVLGDAFSENAPLPSIPEATYGFSPDAVRRALGTPPAQQGQGIDGLVRIETDSFSVDASGVHHLTRTRALAPALSELAVQQAVDAAQRHIVAAQERDGTFRYALDPATGQADNATLNLPRQAGTTYALCELGEPGVVRRTVRRALAAFEPTEHNMGDTSALGVGGDYGLGKSALPLLALLRCRELVGDQNDRLIGQLSRMMLKAQRSNGSFHPIIDVEARKATGDHEALYAAGQAVLSLVLLEQQLGGLKGSAAEPLPSAAQLKSTLDRAMDYYSGPYWPTPLRDFFFFEEGWHCLAARTALTSHRHPAYEQLCIDYVASRMRFILGPDDTSEPNFVGGYGVSDLFPPRNTATAGVGEALNAAIALKVARGMPVEQDKVKLRNLIGFLLRAQWSEAGCYACKDPRQVKGGFSQQLASPSIRIDYVQHAMAAIGHGAKLLELR
jgi:hypothetical protein